MHSAGRQQAAWQCRTTQPARLTRRAPHPRACAPHSPAAGRARCGRARCAAPSCPRTRSGRSSAPGAPGEGRVGAAPAPGACAARPARRRPRPQTKMGCLSSFPAAARAAARLRAGQQLQRPVRLQAALPAAVRRVRRPVHHLQRHFLSLQPRRAARRLPAARQRACRAAGGRPGAPEPCARRQSPASPSRRARRGCSAASPWSPCSRSRLQHTPSPALSGVRSRRRRGTHRGRSAASVALVTACWRPRGLRLASADSCCGRRGASCSLRRGSWVSPPLAGSRRRAPP